MNTSKYFVLRPESDSLAHMPYLHDDWLSAAKEAMAEDGYVFQLRRIACGDYPADATEAEDLGKMGLWVKSRHHGNNIYSPAGVDHDDFTGHVSGADDEDEAEEACLREYVGRDGRCHARHNIIVAAAEFNEAGELVELDGMTEDLPAWRID